MKERHLPLLPDLEVLYEATNTWHIENYRHLPKKARGPKFECGGHPWYGGGITLETTAMSTDEGAGGYFSSPSATMSTLPLFTSSRDMTTMISLRMTGMRACNSPWSCGARTTHRYTQPKVRCQSFSEGPDSSVANALDSRESQV